MTITWQTVPDITFQAGLPAAFSVGSFVSSDLPVTLSVMGTLPGGVTFDAPNKQFLFSGVGSGTAAGIVLVAEDAMPSISAAIATVETVTVNGMVMGPRSAIAFVSSPTTIQNTTANRLMVVVSGGTVSVLEFSRDGIVFDGLGLLGGQFILNPGDMLRITYALAPTASAYPV